MHTYAVTCTFILKSEFESDPEMIERAVKALVKEYYLHPEQESFTVNCVEEIDEKPTLVG